MNLEAFSNHVLLKSIDYLLQFIQIEMQTLENLNPEKLFAKNHKKFDNVIITGGKLYDQALNSEIKRYKK